MDSMGVRFNPISEKYVSLLFDNADSNYAEVCRLACLGFARSTDLKTCTDSEHYRECSLFHRKE